MKKTAISALTGAFMTLVGAVDSGAQAWVHGPCKEYEYLKMSFLHFTDPATPSVTYKWQSASYDPVTEIGETEGLVIQSEELGKFFFPEDLKLIVEQIGTKEFMTRVEMSLPEVAGHIQAAINAPYKPRQLQMTGKNCTPL